MRVRGTPVVPLGGADLDGEYERGTDGDDKSWTRGDVAVISVTEKNKAEGGMFVDASAMKEKLRLSLLKPKYNVQDFYHNEGFFQRVGKDPLFENVTLAVIGLNAFWIWIDTDYNDAASIDKAEPPFVIVENIFCVFFFTELFIRFMAFKHKYNCLRDAWFGFDSCLVAAMVIETWVLLIVKLVLGSSGGEGMSNVSMLRMFRLLRLSRMARMARLFRAMPELLILVKGMVAATRSVFFVCFLLVIIMYVFAIAFKQLSYGTESVGEGLFPTVPKAMLTLLLHGALMDEFSGIIYTLEDESPVCMVLFMAFILLAALTVMNMLIGVLCEVIAAVAETEKEGLQVTFVKETLEGIVKKMDANGDCAISKTEFLRLVDFPDAVKALGRVGVDVVGFVDVADFLFDGDIKMSFPEFMEAVLSLRGSNKATVKDIVDLRKFLRSEMEQSGNHKRGAVENGGARLAKVGLVEQNTDETSCHIVDYSGSMPHSAIGQDPIRLGELQATLAVLEENLIERVGNLQRLLARPFEESDSRPSSHALVSPGDGAHFDEGQEPRVAVAKTSEFLTAALCEVQRMKSLLDKN